MVIAVNRAIARIPHLDSFLADYPDAVVGWGRKRSGQLARVIGRLLGRETVLLEDGFLRSVERRGPPISLMLDDLGVYYDARQPSRMERQIAADLSPEQRARAGAVMRLWRDRKVSKYNHAPDYSGDLPPRYVLVVDQTSGDLSLRMGSAGQRSFSTMLSQALAENPDCTVVVKVHPDHFTHAKSGHYQSDELEQPRVMVIATDCHAASLIAAAQAVYTATSLMGFEALLWGRPVRCFGMPFYAGWGFTDDALPAPSRRTKVTLANLVHAALIACPRYVDPGSGAPWEVEQAIEYIAHGRAALLARLA